MRIPQLFEISLRHRDANAPLNTPCCCILRAELVETRLGDGHAHDALEALRRGRAKRQRVGCTKVGEVRARCNRACHTLNAHNGLLDANELALRDEAPSGGLQNVRCKVACHRDAHGFHLLTMRKLGACGGLLRRESDCSCSFLHRDAGRVQLCEMLLCETHASDCLHARRSGAALLRERNCLHLGGKELEQEEALLGEEDADARLHARGGAAALTRNGHSAGDLDRMILLLGKACASDGLHASRGGAALLRERNCVHLGGVELEQEEMLLGKENADARLQARRGAAAVPHCINTFARERSANGALHERGSANGAAHRARER